MVGYRGYVLSLSLLALPGVLFAGIGGSKQVAEVVEMAEQAVEATSGTGSLAALTGALKPVVTFLQGNSSALGAAVVVVAGLEWRNGKRTAALEEQVKVLQTAINAGGTQGQEQSAPAYIAPVVPDLSVYVTHADLAAALQAGTGAQQVDVSRFIERQEFEGLRAAVAQAYASKDQVQSLRDQLQALSSSSATKLQLTELSTQVQGSFAASRGELAASQTATTAAISSLLSPIGERIQTLEGQLAQVAQAHLRTNELVESCTESLRALQEAQGNDDKQNAQEAKILETVNGILGDYAARISALEAQGATPVQTEALAALNADVARLARELESRRTSAPAAATADAASHVAFDPSASATRRR